MSFFASILQKLKLFSYRNPVFMVHDDDLVKLLTELNLIQDIREQRITCANCKKKISLENISGWQKVEGKLQFFCDSQECISEQQGVIQKEKDDV